MELPAPITQPAFHGVGDLPDRWQLRYPVRHLAAQAMGAGDGVYLRIRTGSRIDVGSWVRTARIWMWVLRRELLLVAAGYGGDRPYCQRVDFGSLQESVYNHVTGKMVLGPADGVPVKGLTMSPVEGYQVLSQIRNHAEVTSSDSGTPAFVPDPAVDRPVPADY